MNTIRGLFVFFAILVVLEETVLKSVAAKVIKISLDDLKGPQTNLRKHQGYGLQGKISFKKHYIEYCAFMVCLISFSTKRINTVLIFWLKGDNSKRI